MLQVAKIAHKTSNSAYEPLLDLQEAASVLGMHWKMLEGKARNKEIPRSRSVNAGDSSLFR